jgi:hypothetical protein
MMKITSRTIRSHAPSKATASLGLVALTMLTGCTHADLRTGKSSSSPEGVVAPESPLLSGVTDRSGRFSALRFPQPYEHKFSVIATSSTATVEQVRRWIAADLAKALALQTDAPRLDRNASSMTILAAGWEFRTDLDIDIDSRTTVDKGVQFDITVSWVTLYNAREQDLFLQADAVRDRIEDALEAGLDGLIAKGSTGSLEYVR